MNGNGVVFNPIGLHADPLRRLRFVRWATPAIQGAGLGLAIAVGSTPGARTTATSTIPVSQRATMSVGARR